MRKRTAVYLVWVVLLALAAGDAGWAQTAPVTQSVGLTLLALSTGDLDAIQASTGYRVGVAVAGVAAGSAAERAGIKARDVLLTAAGKGVDSPEAVEAALAGSGGRAEILAIREGAGGKWEPVNLTLIVPAAGTAPEPPTTAPPTPPVGPQTVTTVPADVDAKLRALDAAHDAGVLTDEEWARKRAELHPADPVLDEAARQKLAALDAARQAGVVTDAEYAAKRAQIVGQATGVATTPAIAAGGATAQPAAASAVPATHGGQVYSHPMGFRFWYPAGWKVQTQEEGLQLVPPDAVAGAGGPTEYYAMTAVNVVGEGITTADDPRVVAFVEEQVAQFLPGLRRTGDVMRLALDNGRAICVDWEAPAAQGQTVTARAYVTILQDVGIALFAAAAKDRMAARDPDLRRVFSSIAIQAGTVDTTIVGRWALTSTYALSNDMGQAVGSYDSYTKAKMVSESQRSLELNADGSATRTTTREMLAGAAGLWIEDKSNTVDRGRWNAGDGHLYLTWENGDVEHYRYRVGQGAQGRELRLESGQSGEVWTQ
jgi:hypothetical protein